MDLMELLASVGARDASVHNLFGDEGIRARGALANRPNYLESIARTVEFLAEIREGSRPTYHFREAMSTSDFPMLFGDVLSRELLGSYQKAPVTWPAYVARRTVRDFRTIKMYTLDGGEGRLSTVAELEEYPERALVEGEYSLSIQKYGARMPFSWEAMINDDLNALADIPARLGYAARRTEEYVATALFGGLTGFNTAVYSSGNGNIVTSNPVLNIANLTTALTQLSTKVDSDGNPIVIDMVHLVVPPALEVTAMNIMNALQVEIVEVGGTTNQKLTTRNWMSSRFRVHVNPLLPIIATSNDNTMWFLIADPIGNRPAFTLAFLTGHETPEIFIKSPNAQRVGGGAVNPMDGDFDTDSIQYKVRHVLGGAIVDPKLTVASNGSGS